MTMLGNSIVRTLGFHKTCGRTSPSRSVALLIDKEPNNLQARSLETLIENRVARGEVEYLYSTWPQL